MKTSKPNCVCWGELPVTARSVADSKEEGYDLDDYDGYVRQDINCKKERSQRRIQCNFGFVTHTVLVSHE